MAALTLRIVGQTLFDADLTDDSTAVSGALAELLGRFQRTMLPGGALLNRVPLPSTRRLNAAIATLDEVVFRLIGEARRSGEDDGTVLAMLLAARDEHGDPMPDRQVRDEVLTLLLAGHETTANALAWTWLLLDRNPDAARPAARRAGRGPGGRRPAGAAPDPGRDRRVDAALPAGLGRRPPDGHRRRAGRLARPGRLAGAGLPVDHPPGPALVGRRGGVPAGALDRPGRVRRGRAGPAARGRTSRSGWAGGSASASPSPGPRRCSRWPRWPATGRRRWSPATRSTLRPARHPPPPMYGLRMALHRRLVDKGFRTRLNRSAVGAGRPGPTYGRQVSTPPPITTLGALRASGHVHRGVKAEIRENLLARLAAGEPTLPGHRRLRGHRRSPRSSARCSPGTTWSCSASAARARPG